MEGVNDRGGYTYWFDDPKLTRRSMRGTSGAPVINAAGVLTYLGGSLMPPEVVRAMEEASKHFVQIPELQKKVGARIAELLGVPAAMVTAGCASAITVATAACVANGNEEKLSRLPDTTGMKNEIVQQKSHRSGYEQQMLLVGTKIVWVETRQELDRAINERTAMMFFLNKADPDGKIRRDEWILPARTWHQVFRPLRERSRACRGTAAFPNGDKSPDARFWTTR